MLAPLLFVWPISIAITHYFSVRVALPAVARSFLRADEIDSVYFRVVAPGGALLAGDRELPPLKDGEALARADAGEVYFRDGDFRGQDLRIAYSYVGAPGASRERWLLVEVGETLEKRSLLANRIIASVIFPQFVIIPVAVLLVWFGLSRGLRPLTWLRERIESRREGDLSPIVAARIPEELQPLTDAFNAMLVRMQHNMDAQRRFISDAAHQVRTPLAGLKMQAQLAMRENDPQQLLYALDNISRNVDRASHMVNQLLALARAEASEHSQQALKPLDLDLLLQQTVESWVGRARARQIDLGFEAAGPLTILGSDFLLREMINNLLDNALRYTPDEGRVTARVRAEGDAVVLEVEDSGIGIAPDEARRVFDRFYRVEGTGVEGSGLGLAIVREIAELHEATASLSPRLAGDGTTPIAGAVARVVFPAADRAGVA